MKKISLLLLLATVSVAPAFAQENATQQQFDQLRGKLQDIVEAQDAQGKRIDELSKRINDLADKVNTPQVNNSASAEDLKALADTVKEIDKKRQSDRELILKEIDKLGRVAVGTSTPRTPRTPTPTQTEDPGTPATPQTGHYYIVKDGDYLSTIAKAYRDQGVKVTVNQILKANPGLDANKLYTGKKIFIPDPNAK
ncbi:MAG: LysM peptidoglycan-binding domain-containing protein [Verrucomicrobiae bacterium]|nr:LysM peptidoglycan-binding domain-containing protein [Verrucomicrobiae bacterium]